MTPDQFCVVMACQVAEACREGFYSYQQVPEPSKAAKAFWAMPSEAKDKLKRKDMDEYNRLQAAASKAKDDALYTQLENEEIEAALLETGCVLKWARMEEQLNVVRGALRRFYRAKGAEGLRRVK